MCKSIDCTVLFCPVTILTISLLVIIGGLIFRFVMVEAGQLTRYLY